MPDLTHEEAHRIAREGTSPITYRIVKLIIVPLFRILFLMRVSGLENIPKKGAAVIAPNHKSFWDAFFLAAVLNRRIFYMGKTELFQGRKGRLLLALGGFPVKRGESDADAAETSLAILRRGDLLALFPEGTRVPDPEALGTPHRGAARFAIETGAPIIPTAITGTEKRRWPLPRRVQVAFGEPIPVDEFESTPEGAAKLTETAVWPTISEDYKTLKARPGLIAGGIAAAGVGVAIYKWRKKD